MDFAAISEQFRPWWVVWLVVLFVGVVFWAYRPKNRKKFEDAAQIPLKDDKEQN